jgi:hypothetical protein
MLIRQEKLCIHEVVFNTMFYGSKMCELMTFYVGLLCFHVEFKGSLMYTRARYICFKLEMLVSFTMSLDLF